MIAYQDTTVTTTTWEQILADLSAEEDVERVVQAARLLDEVAHEAHLPDLYRLIQDDDWYIREVASVPLSRLDGFRALPLLFQALTRGEQQGHDNDLLNAMVVEVLEAHREECAPLLLSMLDDPDPTIRANGAWALGWQLAAVALAPLIAALHDSDASVRGAAVGSLSSFKMQGVMEALLPLLSDSNDQVRVDAVASLGYLGDRRAMPALQAALHDPNERVRSFAVYALEQLGKQKR
jgi:HEAT repeat protein